MDDATSRSGAARAHRALLRFFPPAFRQVYGEDLEAAFRDLWRREAVRPLPARLRFWWSTFRDMATHGLAERWAEASGRSRRPGPRRPLRDPPAASAGLHVEQAAGELRRALRALAARPGFTLAAVLTLALGLASATAMWGAVHGVLLAPLGYEDEDRLVGVWMKTRRGPELTERFGVSDAQIVALREQAPSLDGVGFVNVVTSSAVFEPSGAPASRASWAAVSWNFFTLLGVEARLGRPFSPADAPAGASPVVLSSGAWERHFGRDPDVVGRTIRLGGRDRVVAGVLPRRFRWVDLETPADFWVPYDLVPSRASPFFFWAFARRRPGARIEQVEEQASAILAAVMETVGGAPDVGGPLATVVPLREAQLGSVGPQLRTLAAAVALLLALSVANVTILMLVRLAGRSRECVVRSALGGGPGRVAAPVVAEAACIVAAAAALAVPAAAVALGALRAMAPAGIPRVDTVALSGPVLAGGLVAATGAAALVSIVPAWLLRRLELAPALRDAAGQVAGGRLPRRVRGALVSLQFALAVVLLAGAGLLTRSFIALVRVDPGFGADGILQGRLVLPTEPFWAPVEARLQPGDQRLLRVGPALGGFRDDLVRRLEQGPGVVEVALATHTPLGGRYGGFTPFVREGWEDREMPPGPDWISANAVDPGFLPFLGVELLAGRWLAVADDAAAPPVALVSERLARRFWPDGDALGGRFRGARLVPDHDGGGVRWETQWIEVVGVVRSLREWNYRAADETVYTPLAQAYATGSLTPAVSRGPRLSLLVRHRGDPAPAAAHVRGVVADLLPGVPVDDLRPLESVVDDWLRDPRFYTALFGAFGLVALVLSASGIAAVVGFGVSLRTKEIGLRLALGAPPRHVADVVGREVALFALLGLALGCAVALAGAGLAEGLLFEIGPRDPAAFAASLAALVLAAAGGAWLPARHAFAVDPAEALRHE